MKKNRSVNNARAPKCGAVKRGSYELTIKDVEFMKKYGIEFMLEGKTIRDETGGRVKIK